MNKTNCDVTHNSGYGNLLTSIVAGCLLASVSAVTQAATEVALDHPPMPMGLVIESLDQHPVPDQLKKMARQEIEQMATKGYVDAPDDAVGYIEKAQQDASLKSWQETRGKLKVNAALVQGQQFDDAGLKMLGAVTGGTLAPEGWTAVSRLFVAPGVGVTMLEEIDYVAAGGGLMMIKEAINHEVNGHPAILRVKKGRSGKAVTELTWASAGKIYTLSTNSAARGKHLTTFIDLARKLSD